MPISAFRRQVKNATRNYSAHQIKTREATSNDSWGPSKSIMCELAELTHSPMAFTRIMPIIWKRMNESGKKWRHVYKSLVLLEYLVKAGHDMVVEECTENLYLIDTLKDFQYIEKYQDVGMNVRETAKKICSLLSDDELLKKERKSFKEMRNKFMNSGVEESRSGTPDSAEDISLEVDYDGDHSFSTTNKEMQLQIALGLSLEECKRSDEVRKREETLLQMGIEESQKQAYYRLGASDFVSGEVTHREIDDLVTLGGAELAHRLKNPITSSSTWYTNAVIDQSGAIYTQNYQNPSYDYFCVNTSSCALENSSEALADLNTLEPSAFANTFASGQDFDINQRDIFFPMSDPIIANSHCSPATVNSHLSSTKMDAENLSVDTDNFVDLNNLMKQTDFYTNGGVSAFNGAIRNPFKRTVRNPFKSYHCKSSTLEEMQAAGLQQDAPM
ncbi:hypothetical protein CRE_08526 [Caenorhabditis remanei]|uniref:Uncharacterized protein n=1 Tax=Caenorhabditis remanei TaxID=31234 RepID=E3N6Y0_CAERE|nr:hypothetical protein CRE_08526 [Caenorhabditis remanei]